MAYALLRTQDTSTPEGRARERYRRVALSLASGVVGRGVGAAVGVLTAPLLLSYLGKERFGLYSAITGTVVWLSLLELGIAGGLVNAISEANGRGDRRAAVGYAATGLAALAAVATLGGIVFAAVAGRVPWDVVFGAAGRFPPAEVRWAVIAAVAGILLGVPLVMVPSVYAGLQRAYVGNLFAMITSGATLLMVWVSIVFRLTLPVLIGVVSGTAVAVGIINLFLLLREDMPELRVLAAHVSQQAMQRISRTAIPLLVFQIGALMVNQSQLFILTHTSTLAATADYAVITRIVQIFSGLVIVTTSAFFPALREAMERGDRPWVREGFRRMLVARVGLAAAFAMALILAGNELLGLWLRRDDVQFSPAVWAVLGFHLVAGAWVTAHSELLTVLDRIWAQVGLVLSNGIVTVLLTLWLSPRYGVLGVLIAVAFTTVIGWTWVFPLLTRSILAPRRSP